jgi:hypothetical protein
MRPGLPLWGHPGQISEQSDPAGLNESSVRVYTQCMLVGGNHIVVPSAARNPFSVGRRDPLLPSWVYPFRFAKGGPVPGDRAFLMPAALPLPSRIPAPRLPSPSCSGRRPRPPFLSLGIPSPQPLIEGGLPCGRRIPAALILRVPKILEDNNSRLQDDSPQYHSKLQPRASWAAVLS